MIDELVEDIASRDLAELMVKEIKPLIRQIYEITQKIENQEERYALFQLIIDELVKSINVSDNIRIAVLERLKAKLLWTNQL